MCKHEELLPGEECPVCHQIKALIPPKEGLITSCENVALRGYDLAGIFYEPYEYLRDEVVVGSIRITARLLRKVRDRRR